MPNCLDSLWPPKYIRRLAEDEQLLMDIGGKDSIVWGMEL